MNKSDIGIYGLGVMGQNLALNCSQKGFAVSVYNRRDACELTAANDFLCKKCKGKKIFCSASISDFVDTLSMPRKIMIVVKAGAAVDEVIEQLIPYLETGDIIIDCGNSHFRDSARRLSRLESLGYYFIACGVSGGKDGALNGPSIMPGGSFRAWEESGYLLQAIAAKDSDGNPCCDWIGPGGSGHFVKMTHNGVEYALMQILAESYDFMKRLLGMNTDEINSVMREWNTGNLQSYLLEISADILLIREEDGSSLIENILDCAEQKGTGKDLSVTSMELGVPSTTFYEAVGARVVSGMVSERNRASKVFGGPGAFTGDRESELRALKDAVYCSQLVAYAQGFLLMARASEEYNWGLDLAMIAHIWKNGCIIRSSLLEEIAETLKDRRSPDILLEPPFSESINNMQAGWRNSVTIAVNHGIPVPALSSALAYFDGYRSERLPANLIQAQRDYFGFHGYERIDKPRGTFFHLSQEGEGI
jgi:6-phosphogluconate dehydrogenase